MMLRGQRYKTAKDFKPFVRASVTGYLLGTTFKTKHALAEALEAADPHTQPWGRTRLAYQIDEARRELLGDDDETTGRATGRTRAAEISPTEADLTEGIAFGLEEDDAPLVPVVNPLGGRPQGSTLKASRKHKKVKAALMDSASKAYSERKAAVVPEGGRLAKGAMAAILAEKLEKYQAAHPDVRLDKPENQPLKNSVYRRVLRHEARPEHHRVVVEGSRGPLSLLAPVEQLLLSFIAEAAEVGIYMTTGDLRAKIADLMCGKPMARSTPSSPPRPAACGTPPGISW
jgi:hypothetical protein